MKKVLWISRHPLDAKAVEDLQAMYGPVEVTQKDVVFANNGKDALHQLMEVGSGFDVVGGVWPSQLWVALMNAVSTIPFSLFVVVSVPAAGAAEGLSRSFVYDHLEIVGKK